MLIGTSCISWHAIVCRRADTTLMIIIVAVVFHSSRLNVVGSHCGRGTRFGSMMSLLILLIVVIVRT